MEEVDGGYETSFSPPSYLFINFNHNRISIEVKSIVLLALTRVWGVDAPSVDRPDRTLYPFFTARRSIPVL
jgi:hypothetical protein